MYCYVLSKKNTYYFLGHPFGITHNTTDHVFFLLLLPATHGHHLHPATLLLHNPCASTHARNKDSVNTL
jgi:hypothetical protein